MARSGANLQETILTPANVKASNFGKLFEVHTDGQIYAQPLYVSNLAIAGGTHNVVFVASMLNTVYAIDADTSTVLWSQNFGSPIVPQDVENDQNIVWSTRLGILGTPVIDPATNYMYFVSGKQPAGTYNYSYNLNAIDITTGLPVHGSPVTIAATYSTADLTTPLVFNAGIQNPRPGLALANGSVYIAFASHEDRNAYHGWVLAYSTSTLAQTAAYTDTTLGSQGGIWNAGQAPSVDAAGNVYVSTGNGSFGPTPNNLVQTGNSMIKLSPTLELLDYFTPYNSANLNSGDQDLGSAGLLLIPNTNYILGGGKQGVLYLVDSTDMGKFNSSTDQVRQEFQAVYGTGTSHIHGSPIYFNDNTNGPSVYVWGENDTLRAFEFNTTTGMVNTTPFAKSNMTAPATNNDGAMPGGFLSVSANGDNNGIVWASTPYNGDALHQSVRGVLYAFDAATLNLLWTDKTNDSRDEVGMFAKYVPPIVANGKMFITNFGAVGTNDGTGNLVCYGLLAQLTVTAANARMTAGSALPALTGTVTGLVNGDTVGTTIVVTYSTTATTNSPAGTYPITATVTGSSAGNYYVVDNAGTLTISSAVTPVLTVLANNATRVYGAANPAFSGTVTGAQNGNTFTESFATTATTASALGSYPIVPTASGAGLANYTVTTVNGTLTITQATQTITFPAIAARAYGSAPFAVAASSSAGAAYPVTITVQSGPATIAGGTVTLTGVGTVVLHASQPGNANYSAATATQTFSVTAGQLRVSANNATRVYGAANPTFTGTVTGAAGSDSFTESFSTTATSASNVGSYPIVPAAAGAHVANYAVSIIDGALSVTAAATTTTLRAPAAATHGSSVSLSATVASTAGLPGGVVTFYSGATALGTGTLNGGIATLSTTALAVGTDSLTARYAATGNFGGSTSAAGSITVSTSSQTINFPAIASRVYGSAPFAVSASSSLGATYPVTITVQSGPATITGGIVTVTAVGTVLLQASQPGDAQHTSATATQSFQVTPAALIVAANNASRVFNTANPAWSGTVTGAVGSDSFSESFTTTATTSSNVGIYPIVPAVTGPMGNYKVTTTNGTLTITQATQTITFPAIAARAYGSAPFAVAASSSAGTTYPVTITVQSGPATIAGGTVTLTGVGTVVLHASQPGNTNYSAATATQTFSVTAGQLRVSANNATRVYGAANPTFTGTVTGAGGSDSFTESFSTTATSASNVGSYPIVPAAAGAHLANYTVSIIDGALSVTAAATTTTLRAPVAATHGSSVSLSATVASTAGLPGGVVTFYGGATALGTGTLNGGIATLSTTALAVGTDSLTARYAATGNFGGSTSAAGSITVSTSSQTINFPALASRVYGSAPFAVSASSSLGATYPVTITVQSGPATITGGIVTVTAVGTVLLQASQPGDAKHTPATATQSFQVTPAVLIVAANKASRVFHTANPAFNGTVTGAVGSDHFSESYTTTATTSSNVGIYPIVPAVTGPAGNYKVTTTNGTLTVSAATTTTALSAPVSAISGSSVTLTATVTSSAGTPGGSVTFSSGTAALGVGTLAGGVASLSTTALAIGTDTVTATYAVAGNFAASSGTAKLSITTAAPVGQNSGAYTVAASPTTLSVQMGKAANTMLTFTPSGGYSGTITLSCANLPANASCAFAQNQVTLSGNNQNVSLGLTINTTVQQAGTRPPQAPSALLALAFWWPGGLTSLAVVVRKRKSKMPRALQLCLLLVCACAFTAGLSGCGMSGFVAVPVSSQVSVVATGTAGSVVSIQNVALSLTVTP